MIKIADLYAVPMPWKEKPLVDAKERAMQRLPSVIECKTADIRPVSAHGVMMNALIWAMLHVHMCWNTR